MAATIIGFPIRLGLRGASIAIDGTMAVAGHALGLAERLVEVLTKDGGPDFDIDGSEHEPAQARGRTATETPRPGPPRETDPEPPREIQPEPPRATEPDPPPEIQPEPPRATEPDAPPETEPPPAPIDPAPTHVSEEAVLVDEVAEPGAEDGAGAEVHVNQPWEHYDELGAADVIDRISGAQTAELAAVELYEQTHRRRKTVLEAVERELRQAGNQ